MSTGSSDSGENCISSSLSDSENEENLVDFCADELLYGENENSLKNAEVLSENEAIQLGPKVGINFLSEKDAYHFYNVYAKKMGFSIRWDSTRNNKAGQRVFRKFSCSKEGYRAPNQNKNTKNPRMETRVGCPAYMSVVRKEDKWHVHKFGIEHNHELMKETLTYRLRSQRKMTTTQVAMADIADISGICPRESVEYMANQVSGYKNLGFLHEDYNNHLRKRRQQAIKRGDIQATLKYLEEQRYQNSSFVYEMQLDSEGTILNFFWADPISIVDYHHFGDVICFDTTYRTNKYKRPFGLFVGLNHNKNTIVFGAALLYDETIQSFEWLFKTFLNAMNGKEPQTILTDQDKAMKNAIASIMPRTHHRICIWHMYQNACKHLSHQFNLVIDEKKPFPKDFKRLIYDIEYEDDFLSDWKKMILKYDLQDNEWLHRLFEERHKWAMVYGRHIFTGDMKSTQRCESMNSVLKRYLKPKHNLYLFFQHYERLLRDRRRVEAASEFRTAYYRVNPSVLNPILNHAARVYTPAIFKIVQSEYLNLINCRVLEVIEDLTLKTCVIEMNHRTHIVKYDSLNYGLDCSCKKFNYMGILCCHAFRVLDHFHVMEFPKQYIMKRWTKDAKMGSVHNKERYVVDIDPNAALTKRNNELNFAFRLLACEASLSEEATAHVLSQIEIMLSEVQKCNAKVVLQMEMESECHANKKDQPNKVYCNVPPPLVKELKCKEGGKKGGARLKSCLEIQRRRLGKKGKTTKENNKRGKNSNSILAMGDHSNSLEIELGNYSSLNPQASSHTMTPPLPKMSFTSCQVPSQNITPSSTYSTFTSGQIPYKLTHLLMCVDSDSLVGNEVKKYHSDLVETAFKPYTPNIMGTSLPIEEEEGSFNHDQFKSTSRWSFTERKKINYGILNHREIENIRYFFELM